MLSGVQDVGVTVYEGAAGQIKKASTLQTAASAYGCNGWPCFVYGLEYYEAACIHCLHWKNQLEIQYS